MCQFAPIKHPIDPKRPTDGSYHTVTNGVKTWNISDGAMIQIKYLIGKSSLIEAIKLMRWCNIGMNLKEAKDTVEGLNLYYKNHN